MKNILIIGATSGIGRETVRELSSANNLFLSGRNIDLLESFLKEHKIKAAVYRLDFHEIEKFSSILSQLPELDGVVFCSGITSHIPAKFITPKHYTEVFLINYFAPVMITSGLLKNKKINQNASLVYLSSAAVKHPYFGGALYISSKSALEGYVRTIALELASKKIRANSISPVFVRTEMLKSVERFVTEEAANEFLKKHPLGIINPLEVAKLISFLISENSNSVTGQNYLLGNLD